jgi:hypothetical protein
LFAIALITNSERNIDSHGKTFLLAANHMTPTLQTRANRRELRRGEYYIERDGARLGQRLSGENEDARPADVTGAALMGNSFGIAALRRKIHWSR